MFQFYVQAGMYSFPTVGVPYDKADDQSSSFLGPVPVAYAKLQLTDSFSVSAGKLPTLVGAELAFTPQNFNIERGLLWWQEPVSSRGVQANYASGPLSIAVSWNDGYYSDVWNTGSALVSFAIDESNTLAFDASVTPDSGSLSGNQIYDVMYTFNSAPWTIGPLCAISEHQQRRRLRLGRRRPGGLSVHAGMEPERARRVRGFLGQRLAAHLRAGKLGLVGHRDADLAEGRLLRPRRTVLCRPVRQPLRLRQALNEDNQFRALFETGVQF